jgi:hypothetical protein
MEENRDMEMFSHNRSHLVLDKGAKNLHWVKEPLHPLVL